MDFKLDTSTGDLAVENNVIPLLEGIDAIRQHTLIRLRKWLGEWYQNLDEGVPYREQVLGKGRSLVAIEALFRRIIRTTAGVISVDSLSLDYDASLRTLQVTASATTVSGTLVLNHEELVL